MSSMFDERSPIFPRFHSPSLLFSTSFLPTPTSTTSPSDNPATITRNEEHSGRLVTSKPLTSYEPNEFDDIEITHNPSIFQSSNVRSIYDLGENSTASLDPEFDDEHIRNTMGSPLYLRTCRKFITLMKKACYQSHRRSSLTRGNPLHCFHRKEILARK